MWRQFYPRAHELPVGYNAFRSTLLPPEDWLRRVHVLHDVDVGRKALLWRPTGLGARVRAMAHAHLQAERDPRTGVLRSGAVDRLRAALGLKLRIRGNATADQLASWQHPPPEELVQLLHNLSQMAYDAVKAACAQGGVSDRMAGC